MSLSRASSSTLRSTTLSSRSFTTTSIIALEAKYFNPWTKRGHLKPPPTVPNPLPRLYPQKVVLSDGSTFTSYTTAPTPAILRLTRDVTNNPLWSPALGKGGLGDDEEGRVGRFRKKFEGMDLAYEIKDEQPRREDEDEDVDIPRDGQSLDGDGKVVDDLSWMSEGAVEEKAPVAKVKRGPPPKGGKKK